MAEELSIEEIRDQVAKRVAAEQAEQPEQNEHQTTAEDISGLDIGFVRKCYLSNEVGDSTLFNALHRGKHIYNTISALWLTYLGPHWDIDNDNRALADVENVAVTYLQLIESIQEEIDKLEGDKGVAGKLKSLNNKKKAVISRLDRLRSAAGRAAVLKCAISNNTPLTIHPDQLDQHPLLLPVKNGVIDLRTGLLRPGRSDDYFTMACPIEYKGIDEPAPEFFSYLNTSLDGHTEVIDFLLRALGCAIGATNTERLFVVLFGQHGQNGKGKLMEILYHVLGPLSGPIQAEMLMAQKFAKSADGPSPAVMALKGRRLAWASETEEGASFAAGKLKLYSGGDPLIGRAPNDRFQTTFNPSHTLFLLTNNLPHAPAYDNAFWERIKVIDFPFSFVQRKAQKDHEGNVVPVVLEKHQRHADPDLLAKLKAEASGILAALVRGCRDWQKQGLNPPRKVIDDSLKYRRNEDDLQDFIDQCCHVDRADPNVKGTASDLYKRYRSWWEDVATTRPMNMKKFGTLMSMKFEKLKSSTVLYLGVMVDVTKGMTSEK